MAKRKSVFEVDKKGLAKLLERRGKHFALLELAQNAFDEDGVTEVDMTLEFRESAGEVGIYDLVVEDNAPEGFADITHAYTLFAESKKKGRADQRGRFNLGEKLVIAICDWVQIHTTKGLIEFTDEGRIEHDGHPPRKKGTRFTASLKMTADEFAEAEAAVETLLVPGHIEASFNGRPLEKRIPARVFETVLRTEIADSEGYLRPTQRKTKVSVHEPRDGEKAMLYEMGIPVVETDDRWHVDIAQKVPLNTDRDNVPPGWLRDVRAAVLNNCADLLDADAAKAKWVDDAIEDEKIEAEAVSAVVKGRYGDKAVIEDRSDPEGTKMAMQQGYAVIPGGSFSKDAWKNLKRHEAVKPAGQVTPSPDPSRHGEGELALMEPEHWPQAVKEVAAICRSIAGLVIGQEIEVKIATAITWPYSATWQRRSLPPFDAETPILTFNYGRLGHAWFKDRGPGGELSEKQLALLIHEMAHQKVSDHLTREFYDECCRIGARVARLAMARPTILYYDGVEEPAGAAA